MTPETPARRQRSSRRRRSDETPEQTVPSVPIDAEAEARASAAAAGVVQPDAADGDATDEGGSDVETMPVCDIPYPRTGVEIVATDMRDGVAYHAMHDLRNQKIIGNVTRDSARRLWRYAITQSEGNPCDESDVFWVDDGERGYWKAYKPRGGDVRYNLVYRHNGHLHVFYGVTDEGMDDEWLDVVSAWQAQRQQASVGVGGAGTGAGADAGEGSDAA